jgi:alkanal monooxygenase alpha chain
MIKVGAFLSTAHFPQQTHEEVFDNALAYAQTAERLGYDTVWINEHHFIRFGSCSSSLTMAGFLLGRTTHIRVGTAVVLVPLHHPIEVAEQAALLDQLSGGRLDLGLGRGAYPRDLAVFGCPIEKTQQAMFENVDVMLRAWTEEMVGLESDLRRFPPVPVTPRPRMRPHPPVYIAASSPDTIAWAARLGLPMLLSWQLSIPEMAAQVERYAQAASAAGRDPATVGHIASGIGYVADSQQEAERAVADNITWWYEIGHAAGSHEELAKYEGYQYLQKYNEQARTQGITTPREMARRAFEVNPIGAPERCRAWLHEVMERTEIRRFALFLDLAAQRERVEENLERFAVDVMKPLQNVRARAKQSVAQSQCDNMQHGRKDYEKE